jgi:hypothetical protein
MDLRTKSKWKELFEEGLGLKNVTQIVLPYPSAKEGDVGSLFTIGYK